MTLKPLRSPGLPYLRDMESRGAGDGKCDNMPFSSRTLVSRTKQRIYEKVVAPYAIWSHPVSHPPLSHRVALVAGWSHPRVAPPTARATERNEAQLTAIRARERFLRPSETYAPLGPNELIEGARTRPGGLQPTTLTTFPGRALARSR